MKAKKYEYRTVNVSMEPSPDPRGLRKATIESTANRWAEDGWRVVAVMQKTNLGSADCLLVEREKK